MAVKPLSNGADAQRALDPDVYVSCQPVVDTELRVAGYRVSYAATGLENLASDNGRLATKLFDDVLSAVGLEDLVGSSIAHLTVSSDMLLTVGPPPVRPNRAILRVSYETATDPRLAEPLRELTEDRYRLALCDLPNLQFDPRMLATFKIVEVDCAAWDELEAAAAVAMIEPADAKPLASGLLNYMEFEMARALGFQLFTGPFFSVPRVTAARRIPAGDAATLAALAQLRADADIEQIEQLVQNDLGLSVKLLRYINSAYYGHWHEISSIRQAVMLLGPREICRWLLVIALAGGPTTPRGLSVMALTRARMCQLLAERAGFADEELFTVGLLSLADALLEQPLDEVVSQLRLAPDLAQTLLWHTGPAGAILDSVLAFEAGEFSSERLAEPYRSFASGAYRESMRWARETVAKIV